MEGKSRPLVGPIASVASVAHNRGFLHGGVKANLVLSARVKFKLNCGESILGAESLYCRVGGFAVDGLRPLCGGDLATQNGQIGALDLVIAKGLRQGAIDVGVQTKHEEAGCGLVETVVKSHRVQRRFEVFIDTGLPVAGGLGGHAGGLAND